MIGGAGGGSIVPFPGRIPAQVGFAREELIVAVELDDREREAQIRLAAPLTRSDLLGNFSADIVSRDEVVWDA